MSLEKLSIAQLLAVRLRDSRPACKLENTDSGFFELARTEHASAAGLTLCLLLTVQSAAATFDHH